ncbi:MAG: prenyltransferase/squalene oxidase repeat-containing protein [Phycisphaeraceae bacterium]
MMLPLLVAPPAAVLAQGASPRPEMITPQTEAAIAKGMSYLARTQSHDGSWGTSGGYGSYPCAMTSLAGLSLLAGGNTSVEGQYAKNVRKAVDYVMSCANPNGLISRMGEEMRPMYGHGFAMLFLAQAYGMERDQARRDNIRRILEKAVELTGRSQSVAGGWLYTPDSGGDEGSVTVTQIQGLRAVRNAGIKVPKTIIEKAAKYIENSANPDGGIRYTAGGGGPSRPPITAAAVATLYNAGEYENPVAENCLKYIKNLLQAANGSTSAVYSGHEFYSMLYTGQAMYLSGEENWKYFFNICRDDLVKRQTGDGSWNGDGVGTTYGTAIALLTLQLPYKYLPILQR